MNKNSTSNEMNLSDLKENENKILRFFNEYCDSNSIQYFLCNGTLLGAVKYQGFIPWDDDIDVCLLRNDYDKLISSFHDDDEYTLFEFTRNSDFLYPFAKLSLNNTLLIEDGNSNGVNLGVNIDIFPIDFVGSNLQFAKLYTIFCRFFTALLQGSKIDHECSQKTIEKKSWVSSLILHLGKIIPSGYLIKVIKNNATRFRNYRGSKYMACLAWPAYKEKEVVVADIYKSSLKEKFEGELYPIPIGFNQYLMNLYGDYHQDPPFDKQKTHHNNKAYFRVED